MFNTLLLRFTLLCVRIAYYLAPVIAFLAKFLFWGFIGIVTILLLLLIL